MFKICQNTKNIPSIWIIAVVLLNQSIWTVNSEVHNAPVLELCPCLPREVCPPNHYVSALVSHLNATRHFVF